MARTSSAREAAPGGTAAGSLADGSMGSPLVRAVPAGPGTIAGATTVERQTRCRKSAPGLQARAHSDDVGLGYSLQGTETVIPALGTNILQSSPLAAGSVDAVSAGASGRSLPVLAVGGAAG